MTTKLPPPPGICEECYEHQTFHSLDQGEQVYYCSHHDTLAISKNSLDGWLVETGVSPDDWIRRADVAERTLDLLGAGLKKKH